MRDLEETLARALAAAGDGEDFVLGRDPGAAGQDWAEIVRHVAALANSGGGVMLFESPDGPAGADLTSLPGRDTAEFTRRFRQYTGVDLPLEVRAADKDGRRVTALMIPPAEYPIPVVRSGAGADAGNPGEADSGPPAREAGVVYFRHDRESAPAEQADFVGFFDRKLEQKRKMWLAAIRQVVNTPAGKTAVVSYDDEPQPLTGAALALPPKYVPADPDRTHPYTPKELIAAFNERVTDRRITNYDVLAIRYHHELDGRDEFIFHIHLTSPRYSDQFLEWLIACHRADPEFFNRAREAYAEKLRKNRKKRPRRR
ncbi:MAG: hypothetical protein R3174_09665 [Gammaproteobacteria bacterium]|nr:hypothetical protein [Gammaproteobacteria bacterium]